MMDDKRYSWSRLNHMQIGRYAEYLAKMEFTLFGFDVYTAEVDDKGIDFILRKGGKYYDVQVKSVRGNNYVFFPKDKFKLRENLLALVVVFHEGSSPHIYLFPALAWKQPNELLVSRDYEGKQSKPEWGLSISGKNKPILDQFAFNETIVTL